MLVMAVSPSLATMATKSCAAGASSASLLQKKVAVNSMNALGEEDGQAISVTSAHLAQYTQFVETMASRVVGHNLTMSDAEKEALTVIRQFVNDFNNSIWQQHLTSNCSVDATNGLGIAAGLKTTMQTSRGAHSSCRQTEKTDKRSATAECDAYELYSKSSAAVTPSCTCSDLTAAKIASDALSTTTQSCIIETKTWIDGLEVKRAACANAEEVYENRTVACDQKQTTFETSFCYYALKQTDVCGEQTRCRDHSIEARRVLHAEVEESESARKSDYAAGRKLLCFLNVFEAENVNKSTNLSACLI